MKKNMLIIITAAEVIGFLLISWLVPAETTGQIIGKTAAMLAWIGLSFWYRKKYLKKLEDEGKNDK